VKTHGAACAAANKPCLFEECKSSPRFVIQSRVKTCLTYNRRRHKQLYH
jgi:hypothetical protein